MGYLLTVHIWWVLAALILGAAVGWLSCRHEPRVAGLGWLGPAGLAVALAAAVAAFMLLNGASARWLETALLLVAAYGAGACVGCLLHGFLGERAAVAAGPAGLPSPGAKMSGAAGPRLPLVKPYVWRAAKQDGALTLSGHLPSDDVRRRLLDVANASQPLPVIDSTQLGSGAPGGLDAMAGAVFRHLDLLTSGSATVTGTRYALAGAVADRAAYDAVVEAVRQLPAGYTLARLDIPAPPARTPAPSAATPPSARLPAATPATTPAPAASSSTAPATGRSAPGAAGPPVAAAKVAASPALTIVRESKAIMLSGVLPSQQVRADVIGAIRSRETTLPIVDMTSVSPGQNPTFALTARLAGTHAARLATGRVQVSPTRYGLQGVVQTVADQDALLAASRALPLGMSLARADIILRPSTRPALAVPTPSTMTGSARPAPAAPSAEVAPSPPPDPVVASPAIDGSRPAGLDAPRNGRADDLKRIRGIGKQNEGRLHGLGIWHFDQIAAWSLEEAKWVGGYLAFPGRIEREEWIVQAKELAAGRETAFSRRAARGEVPTSRDAGDLGQDNLEVMAPRTPPPGKGS